MSIEYFPSVMTFRVWKVSLKQQNSSHGVKKTDKIELMWRKMNNKQWHLPAGKRQQIGVGWGVPWIGLVWPTPSKNLKLVLGATILNHFNFSLREGFHVQSISPPPPPRCVCVGGGGSDSPIPDSWRFSHQVLQPSQFGSCQTHSKSATGYSFYRLQRVRFEDQMFLCCLINPRWWTHQSLVSSRAIAYLSPRFFFFSCFPIRRTF